MQYRTAYSGTPLTVFAHESPDAFCAGLLRPRVYLSSTAVESVEDSELAAVIEHESHHCRRCDPLRILLGVSLVAITHRGWQSTQRR